MKFKARIVVEGDAENIEKIFKAEDKNFKRSSYEMKASGEDTIFEIQAEDATALRSTLDSIAKGLKIYEDMKDV